MCFNLGYNFKNGKLVRFMKESDRDDGEEECKGLLLKEIERWKKQQEKSSAPAEASSTSSTTTPSKGNNHLISS
ncbi:hypothetical protein NC651_018508 [Populus alba x Populus x berolinensis]|nr:hypothetical protein NC651_018508 [Populus alba x Populus x berolinensis]